jgi:hypothetical protein
MLSRPLKHIRTFTARQHPRLRFEGRDLQRLQILVGSDLGDAAILSDSTRCLSETANTLAARQKSHKPSDYQGPP